MISRTILVENNYTPSSSNLKQGGKQNLNTQDYKQTDLANLPYDPLYKLSFGSKPLTRLVHNMYKKAFSNKTAFKDLSKRIFEGSLESYRIKTPNSMTHKVIRKGGKINSLKEAPKVVEDVLAARSITDGSQKQTDEIIGRLVEEIKKGNLTIKSIGNHSVKGSKPYLSKGNIETLQAAQNTVIKSPGKYSHGYVTANIKFKTVDGIPGEFQLKGNHCFTIERATHMIYELEAGRFKASGRFIKEKKELMKEYNQLCSQQLNDLNKYKTKYYKYLRAKELGEVLPRPLVPKRLPEIFDMENLIKLAQ